MKKTIALCMMALLLALGGIGEASSPSALAPAAHPLTDKELSAAVGGGFWGCAFTFVAASALVVGVGIATAGAGALFVGAVLGAGTLGVTAELNTCKDL
jgi:hypothetical protein